MARLFNSKKFWIVSSIFITLTVCLSTDFRSMASDDLNRTIHVGLPFKITLETNPSTGYQWTPIFDKEFFRLESRTTEPAVQPMPGSPSKELFTFVPHKEGVSGIVFRYQRSWEEEPVKILKYRLKIER